jgi:hypothetical protein
MATGIRKTMASIPLGADCQPATAWASAGTPERSRRVVLPVSRLRCRQFPQRDLGGEALDGARVS